MEITRDESFGSLREFNLLQTAKAEQRAAIRAEALAACPEGATAVEIYERGAIIATGYIDGGDAISGIKRCADPGAPARQLLVSVISGKHTGRTASIEVAGDDATRLSLKTPLPFGPTKGEQQETKNGQR